jgi:hypothetical protein
MNHSVIGSDQASASKAGLPCMCHLFLMAALWGCCFLVDCRHSEVVHGSVETLSGMNLSANTEDGRENQVETPRDEEAPALEVSNEDASDRNFERQADTEAPRVIELEAREFEPSKQRLPFEDTPPRSENGRGRDVIRRHMRRHFCHFNYCALEHVGESLQVPRVVVEFVIDLAGRAVEVEADSDSPYAVCLENAVRRIVFDMRLERPLSVVYPINPNIAQ